MADNVKYSEPTSGTVIATDDLGGGVQIQRTKTAFGIDGVATDVSSLNPLPVCAGISADVSGLQRHLEQSAGSSAVAVKAAPGRLAAVHAANRNPHTCFVQVFDATVAQVTVGVTLPALVLAVPPGDGDVVYGQLEQVFGGPVEFAAAVTYACTTTPTGSTAPGIGLVVSFLYK